MEHVKGLKWEDKTTVSELVNKFSTLGFQSIELSKAQEVLYKMKKEGAKTYLTFTSNLGTSGMSSFFAQLIELKVVDVVVTTAGSIEEDIMKAIGEKFQITRFNADDVELHEKGHNRIGNLVITNDSYQNFEGFIVPILREIAKKNPKISSSDLLKEIGLKLHNKDSFLYQAAINNIPVFCPALTDGSIGFQLYFARQKVANFNIDIIDDFKKIMFLTTQDDKKGIIALGGGSAKHFAILSTIINGGMDYAVYITTARATSGSMSGATTSEAKSWGKVKDDADSVTVHGDATILFPLVMFSVLDRLRKERDI